MNTTKYLKALIFLLIPIYGYAESDSISIGSDSNIALAKCKIEAFVNHLSNIANTDLTDFQRQAEIKAALVLFIAGSRDGSLIHKSVSKHRIPLLIYMNSGYSRK